MFTATLTTVAALEMVGFGEDDVTFRAQVIILFIKFISEAHVFDC